MNRAGIFQVSQLTDMTADAVRDLEQKLGAKGRVERDDWVGQARRLSGLDG